MKNQKKNKLLIVTVSKRSSQIINKKAALAHVLKFHIHEGRLPSLFIVNEYGRRLTQ